MSLVMDENVVCLESDRLTLVPASDSPSEQSRSKDELFCRCACFNNDVDLRNDGRIRAPPPPLVLDSMVLTGKSYISSDEA